MRGPAALGDRDTIAAIATPPGAGGVGIVRLSGPSAVAVAASLIGRHPDTLEDRRMVAAVARDPIGGHRIDDVLCVVMRGPRSFTGEDVAEIHGHGGAVNMAQLLRAVLAGAGAVPRGSAVRPAEPGEFTRRAFENGRLDLTRAEAVLAVIEAASERALRVAQAQLAGGLGEQIRALRTAANELLADVEAGIDFPEEGLDLAARSQIASRAADLAASCRALAGTFEAGRALREGVHVALCGPTNAGKSSLFNRLVGSERALVAEEPGTTRDFVEAKVVWRGISVTLIDTAGLRQTESDVERRGIELGTRRARQADIEVHLTAADSTERMVETPPARRVLSVISKGDRQPPGTPPAGLVTSALTGEGIDALIDAILERVMPGGLADETGVLLTSEWQRTRVAQAGDAFERSVAAPAEEAAAMELREAIQALAEVLGEQVGDEMLDALFARFCIGK